MILGQPRKRRSNAAPLLVLLGAIVVGWALYGLVILVFPFEGDFWDARGKFGDMFGAFNALFTACAFGALLYGIRLEYKAFRRQELHTALSGQLDTLIQVFGMPEVERVRVWKAIMMAPGAACEDLSIEQAIAFQISYLDRLMAGEDLDFVPTYGRPSNTESAKI